MSKKSYGNADKFGFAIAKNGVLAGAAQMARLFVPIVPCLCHGILA
jgi:hypothetical protein